MQNHPTFFHDLTVVPGVSSIPREENSRIYFKQILIAFSLLQRYEFYSFGGVRNETRVNHLYHFQLLNKPDTLTELCWLRVTDLLRTFYPPRLTPTRLESHIRAATTPLLGLSTASTSVGANVVSEGEMDVSGVNGILAFTKSVLSYLLGKAKCKCDLILI